jgi:DNA-directed RNA polymerase subunit RPC12/RpoP
MEKYGAIKCPHCGSMKTTLNNSATVPLEQSDLVKMAGAANRGGSYLCLDCSKTFVQTGNSCED